MAGEICVAVFANCSMVFSSRNVKFTNTPSQKAIKFSVKMDPLNNVEAH